MRVTFAALAASMLFALPVQASTIVQNGSFESYDASKLNSGGWHVYGSIPGWTTVSGSGIEIQTNPTLGFIDAQDGYSYVELDSNKNSSMTQSVYLDVGKYLLSFFYSPRTNKSDDNGIDFSVAGLSGNISGPSANPYTANGLWTQISGIFAVSTAGSYDLTFAATGTDNSLGGLVDNVAISAVPVPAAGFLLFGALGGLAALRRRRKA